MLLAGEGGQRALCPLGHIEIIGNPFEGANAHCNNMPPHAAVCNMSSQYRAYKRYLLDRAFMLVSPTWRLLLPRRMRAITSSTVGMGRHRAALSMHAWGRQAQMAIC